MFFGIDLKELFYFPIRDAEARTCLLIGCLVSLLGFIIPILPFIVLIGYMVQIAKQVLNNESPHMVRWDNWGDLFTTGGKVFVIRFIYALPLILLLMPMMVASFILPVVSSNSSNPGSDPFFFVFMGIFALTMCLIFPLSIAAALLIPPAEMHVVATDELAAGFRFREWWAVLRANLGGFIAAFAIYYVAAMVLGIVVQVLMATLIFACLLPFLLPAATTYILLIMFVTVAQAYRDGKAKLAQNQVITAGA